MNTPGLAAVLAAASLMMACTPAQDVSAPPERRSSGAGATAERGIGTTDPAPPDRVRASDGCRARPVPRSIGPTVEGWGEPVSMAVCVYRSGRLVASTTTGERRAAQTFASVEEAQRREARGGPVCPANDVPHRVVLRIAMIDRLGPQGRPTLRQDLLVDPSGCGSIEVPTLIRSRPASVLLDRETTRGWADLPTVLRRVPPPVGGVLSGSW